MNDIKQKLQSIFGADRIHENEILAQHCNWRAGGPADLFVVVRNTDELKEAIICAREHAQPVTILGYGANVLVADKGIRGLVILNRAQRISFLKDSIIEADAGTNLAVLAREAGKENIGNLEFLVGIPGTVGAAVAVNAGTRTEWLSSILHSVLVLHNDNSTTWILSDKLDFSYRNSVFKRSGEIVLAARLQGQNRSRKLIEQNMAEHLSVRKTQPTGPSAGSVFTNPAGDYAGRLIEACGLKGYTVGGAQVSEKHANFILNVNNATAADIKAVIDHVKSEVKAKFNLSLAEEIRYLGEW